MEHAIALAYLISCLLLAASFPIVLIRKNQNGTEDVFFAHIQGFLLLLLLALLFNMMLHYYQTVFAPAQRDTPLMLCNLLCDLCVFFWIEMQRCVVTSRLGSMVRKLCRLYLITYLSVWILANTPQLPDKIVLCYLELLLLLFLLLHVIASGFEQLRGKSADQLFLLYSIAVSLLLLADYASYMFHPRGATPHTHLTIWFWRLIAALTFGLSLYKGIMAPEARPARAAGETGENSETSDFETALQAVKRDFGLTERELEILRAFSFEHTNAKIAEELFISENTVKTHIRRMFGKMQCGSRGEAIEEVRKRM